MKIPFLAPQTYSEREIIDINNDLNKIRDFMQKFNDLVRELGASERTKEFRTFLSFIRTRNKFTIEESLSAQDDIYSLDTLQRQFNTSTSSEDKLDSLILLLRFYKLVEKVWMNEDAENHKRD